MMIPPSVAGFFSKYGIYVGVAIAASLILMLAYCQGKGAGEQEEINDQLEREVEFQGEINDANEGAASVRVEDRLTIEQQRRELQDAIEQGEDPDTVRARRGCIILRQQGRDTSSIAACRRFEGGSGTPVPD